jgi:hypothetical protein
MPRPSDIRNEQLREVLNGAQADIRRGDFTAAVKQCTGAVRQLLVLRPDVLTTGPLAGTRLANPPFVGVRIVTEGVPAPEVIFDRDKFVMAEALAWYQYAMEAIIAGEP